MPADADIHARLQSQTYGAAFELLVPRYQDKVFRLSFGILHDRAWAEDTTQDTLVRIWRALPGFAGQSALSTWIYAIAKNGCLSELRKQRLQVSIDAESDYHVDVANLSVVDADDSATVSVGRLLEQLPDRYRQAVTLFYMEDKSYEQIARSLGMPLGTVKAMLHRARKRLMSLSKDRSHGHSQKTRGQPDMATNPLRW
jgi:RNA polymerase sigma-70 factor (ECF subfamily)